MKPLKKLTRLLLRATVLLCRTRLPRTLTSLQLHPTKSLPQDTAPRRTKLLLQAIMLPWILTASPLTMYLLRDTVLHLTKLPETRMAQLWIHLVASILPMASLETLTLFHTTRKDKTCCCCPPTTLLPRAATLAHTGCRDRHNLIAVSALVDRASAVARTWVIRALLEAVRSTTTSAARPTTTPGGPEAPR